MTPSTTRHPFPSGLAPAPAVLLDERRRPDFRDLFGTLSARSTRVASAVTRVRLSTLDLTSAELAGIRSLRVLVAELNVLQLDAEARALLGQPRRARAIRFLARLLESGILEIRSAPLGGWSPDFTVFEDGDGAMAVLTGFHWFDRPYPHRGPALNALHGREGARLAARRHEELWEQAHDVGAAIWSLLARAERCARAVVEGTGAPPPAPRPVRPVATGRPPVSPRAGPSEAGDRPADPG